VNIPEISTRRFFIFFGWHGFGIIRPQPEDGRFIGALFEKGYRFGLFSIRKKGYIWNKSRRLQ